MLRLKEIRKSKKLTQQQVADAMEIHLTNYNKLETGATEMTLSKMVQLSAILQVEPADLISRRLNARVVTINQHLEAGNWGAAFDWPESDWYDVAIPDDPKLHGVNLYGAKLVGPSMNKRYQDGSAIIYVGAWETVEEPAPGKRYVVEVQRADGMRERTVKRLWTDETDKQWLVPESTNPRHQTPIDPSNPDGKALRILGRVVYSVQPDD